MVSAYCPHQGVHIGCGGAVDGEGIRCPYHRWKFGVDGKLLHIPQTDSAGEGGEGSSQERLEKRQFKDGEQPDCKRERNHLESFPSVEVWEAFFEAVRDLLLTRLAASHINVEHYTSSYNAIVLVLLVHESCTNSMTRARCLMMNFNQHDVQIVSHLSPPDTV